MKRLGSSRCTHFETFLSKIRAQPHHPATQTLRIHKASLQRELSFLLSPISSLTKQVIALSSLFTLKILEVERRLKRVLSELGKVKNKGGRGSLRLPLKESVGGKVSLRKLGFKGGLSPEKAKEVREKREDRQGVGELFSSLVIRAQGRISTNEEEQNTKRLIHTDTKREGGVEALEKVEERVEALRGGGVEALKRLEKTMLISEGFSRSVSLNKGKKYDSNFIHINPLYIYHPDS